MATSKDRLDKIAQSLNPKQAVIAWMEEVLREEGFRRARPSAGDDPFRVSLNYVFQVRQHQGVVTQIAKEYFDGHPVLWKSLAEQLATFDKNLHEIDCMWKLVEGGESFRKLGRQRKTGRRNAQIHILPVYHRSGESECAFNFGRN
jgi:hypothetical protein